MHSREPTWLVDAFVCRANVWENQPGYAKWKGDYIAMWYLQFVCKLMRNQQFEKCFFYSHGRNTSDLKAGHTQPAQQNLELNWISISSGVVSLVVHRSEGRLSAAITLCHRTVSGFLTCQKVWSVNLGLRPQLKQSHRQIPPTFSGFYPHCACTRRQTQRLKTPWWHNTDYWYLTLAIKLTAVKVSTNSFFSTKWTRNTVQAICESMCTGTYSV